MNTCENDTYSGSSHSSYHTYQGWQNRRLNYYVAPFRPSYTDCDQQGFHHRGSTRSGNSFHNTYPSEYSNAYNTSGNNQQKAQNARTTVSESHYLSFIMIEQTIIQAALTSIEMFDGTKSKFEVWTEATEMWQKYQVKMQYT